MKRLTFICFIWLVSCGCLSAQKLPVDTTVRELPGFEAKANRFQQFNVGIKVTLVDSLTQKILAQQSLAQLLALSSPVFIKAYGQGQLATTSFRGAGAEHTAILWNGINLQNSMNGQTDFSLLPAGFMNEVAVQFGGNASLYGSGAIGGAILLNNHAAFEKPLTLNYQSSFGSFGLRQHWLGFAYGRKRYYLKLKAFNSIAENNFQFRNYSLADKPLQLLRNASTNANGVMAEAGYKINTKQTLNVRYWYQYANRNIPPTIGMDVNAAYQVDESNRLAIEWKRATAKKQTIVRGALLTEMLNYQDPATDITGISHSTAWITELDHTQIISKRIQLNAGFNYTRTNATNKNYSKAALRNSLAAFTSANIKLHPKWLVTLNARQELTDGGWLPFTAGFGTSFKLNPVFQFTAHANKSYRLPTFNDLYWVTGNPNLKAESGWEQELGAQASWFKKRSSAIGKLSAFNRNTNNWILWQPNGGSWSPNNVKQVWSRGVELDIKYSIHINRVQLNWTSDFSYVLSTNQKANFPGDETVGKQLIYIPRFTHRHWLQFIYNNYYMACQLAYTGYRFTSSDNSSYLNDYVLMNAFMGYACKIKLVRLDVKVQCNNIMAAEYQVLPSRPMPLRNYLITIGITY